MKSKLNLKMSNFELYDEIEDLQVDLLDIASRLRALANAIMKEGEPKPSKDTATDLDESVIDEIITKMKKSDLNGLNNDEEGDDETTSLKNKISELSIENAILRKTVESLTTPITAYRSNKGPWALLGGKRD